MSELIRANRVIVKGTDDLVAEFYRTHKYIISVKLSELPDNLADMIPKNGNKSQIREEFRALVKNYADKFGVNYDNTDRRTKENIRLPKYTNDEELMEDVTKVMNADIPGLIKKCKYDITYAKSVITSIKPKSTTGSGTPLSQLGIADGKYKNGNWAWANIMTEVVMYYNGDNKKKFSIYIQTQLVSGQIKKTKFTTTGFNELISDAIVDAGYATEEELNPPKQTKSKKANKKPELYESSTIKKMKKDELYEYANSLGIVIPENTKFQTVRSAVIKHVKDLKGE